MKISRKSKGLFWVFLVIAIIVLSWIGLSQYYPQTNTLRYLPDRIFRLIKILMGYDPISPSVEPENVPFALIAVKILVTILLLRALLKVVERVFHEQYTQWRIALKKDHTIVVGIGDKGSRILRDYQAQSGRSAVAIERQNNHNNLPALRREGHAIVIGDASDSEVLQSAGVARARDIICFAEQEQAGIQVASALKTAYGDKSDSTLQCFVHLNNPRLVEAFHSQGQGDKQNGVQVRFFNLHNMVARRFFAELPYALQTHLQNPQAEVRFLLFGFDHAAQALLLQALRVFHLLPGQCSRWDIFAPEVAAKAAVFRDRYPQINHIAMVAWHEDDGAYAQIMAQYGANLAENVALVAICAGESGDGNLNIAAELLHAAPYADFPIYVRNVGGRSMSELVQGAARKRLHFFGDHSDFCHYELITGSRQDRLARAIHADYLEQIGGTASESKAYQSAWAQLGEDGKDANRAQADHILYKLLLSGQLPTFVAEKTLHFSREQIEALAITEHARWAAHRYLNGWRYSEVRDDRARLHPSLVAWEALSEAEKQKDRDTILRLPHILRDITDISL